MRDHEELYKFKTTLNWEKSVLQSQENLASVIVRYIIILGKEKHLDYGSPCRVSLNLKKSSLLSWLYGQKSTFKECLTSFEEVHIF